MTIKQIKQAIDNGRLVMLYNDTYEVVKDDLGQYLIICLSNGHCIGLHGQEGTKYENDTQYPLADFYIVKDDFKSAKSKADKYARKYGEISQYTVLTKQSIRKALTYILIEAVNICNDMPIGSFVMIQNRIRANDTIIYKNL